VELLRRGRVLSVEVHIVTSRGATEILVDFCNNGSAADLVVVIGGGQTRHGFVFMSAGNIDSDVVTIGGGTIDRGELCELAAHRVDLLVDFCIVGNWSGNLHTETVISGSVHLGTDLDHSVEHDRARLLARCDFDFGGSDDIDVVLDDRAGVVVGEGLPEGLLTPNLVTELGLQNSTGRLARTKSRHSHLTSYALECGINRRVELRLVDFDRHLYAILFKCFDVALHGGGVYGAHRSYPP